MNPVSNTAVLPSKALAAPPAPGGESSSEFSNALARAQQTRQDDRQTERQQERLTERQREARGRAHGPGSPAAASTAKATETSGGTRGRPSDDAPGAVGTPDAAEVSLRPGRAPDAQSAAEDPALPPWLDTVLGRRLPATDAVSAAGLPDTDRLDGPTSADSDPGDGEAPANHGTATSSRARDALDAAQAHFMRTNAALEDAEDTEDAGGTAVSGSAGAGSGSAASDPSSRAAGVPTGAQATHAAGATGVAGTSGAGGASTATSVDVPTRQISAPLHSQGFAPALGAQLNLMVRDGVTEARLNLNPAEMGPISVQIRIDGQHARVEMAAEMAGTRQALEQAMPALASALRDSGLTLTGGGVFEHAHDARQAGADGQPGRGGRSGPGANDQGEQADPAEAGRPAHAMPRGVVDLYA